MDGVVGQCCLFKRKLLLVSFPATGKKEEDLVLGRPLKKQVVRLSVYQVASS